MPEENPIKEFHIPIKQSALQAATVLAQASGLSIGKIKSIMQKGAVWLTDGTGTHRLRRSKKALPEDSTLHLYYNPTILDAQMPKLHLIADEGDYSIWVKPRGVLSQGTKWGDLNAINRCVEKHDTQKRQAFVVHRLDRAATGLMLLAHTKRLTRDLSAMFAKKHISKTYLAIVKGQFEMTDDVISINQTIDDKQALSHILQAQYLAESDRTKLKINIETGRKHQIRKHLKHLQLAIIGDRLYAADDSEDLQLYATSLEFICPISGDSKSYSLPESFHH